MTRHRLLYVLPKPDFFTEGGRGRVTHALGICEGFLQNEWDVTVISGPGARRHWFCPPELSLVVVPEEARRARGLGPVGQLAWLARFHRALRYEIKGDGQSVVLMRYSVRWLPWLCRLGGELHRSGTPSALEVNSFGYHRVRERLPGAVSTAVLRLEMTAPSRFDLTYVVSPELRELLATRGFREPMVTVLNGVSTRLLSLSEKFGEAVRKGRRPQRCVYFGSFHSYYDFAALFDAYRCVRSNRSDVELHFHGTGSEGDRIASLARDIDGAHLHGRYEIGDLLDWLDADRDILVLPPKEEHDVPLSGGLSTKLFEYMAMGLPLVASEQVDGILDHGRNALLYDMHSPVQLAAQIECILDEPELATRIGREVRHTVRTKHTWRARCKKLIDAFTNTFGTVDMELEQTGSG